MVEKTAKPTKTVEKVKQPGRIARWWRETIGELRKVSWPTPHDAWRLTVSAVTELSVSALASWTVGSESASWAIPLNQYRVGVPSGAERSTIQQVEGITIPNGSGS